MRRWYLAAMVGMGTFFSAATAFAVEAAATAPEPSATPWATLVLAALGALGVCDRLARWVVKYRRQLAAAMRVCREAFAVIEVLATREAPADPEKDPKRAGIKAAGVFAKTALKNRDPDRDPDERAVVADAAAEAERRTGHNGSATTAARAGAPAEKSKGARVLHGIGTAVKFLAGFLPVVGRVVDR